MNRDRYLTEKMGLCWHVGKRDHWDFNCEKCGKLRIKYNEPNHSFSEPASYALLHKWMGEQKLWDKFYFWNWKRLGSFYMPDANRSGCKFHELTDCSERADLIYEYLKGE